MIEAGHKAVERLKNMTWEETVENGAEIGIDLALNGIFINCFGKFSIFTLKGVGVLLTELSDAAKAEKILSATQKVATPVTDLGKDMAIGAKLAADNAPEVAEEVIETLADQQQFIASENNIINTIKGISEDVVQATKTIEGAKPISQINVDNLLEIANTKIAGGNTAVGRAFQKHSVRKGTAFTGDISGNSVRNTEQGLQHLNSILKSKDATFVIRKTNAFGDVIDIRLPDGKGARWTADGKKFIGFLEKYTPIK